MKGTIVTTIIRYPHPEITEDLSELRRQNPLTQCITNVVVTGFTANVLLAVGASPAMVIGVEEAAEFARIANALLINVGTVSGVESRAMLDAAQSAHEHATPWTLDPVAVGALRFRTKLVEELLNFEPTVIKGNASEILALSGREGGAKGTESIFGSEEAAPYAKELAVKTGSVVVVTGATDYISDGDTVIGIPGGDAIMTKVTGTGCSLGALIASLTAVAPNPLRASTAACALYAAAGERAALESKGPGSFAVNFLDQLTSITTSLS